MTNFSYPDIYRTKDVAFYNYLFKQDRLIRSMGKAINDLEDIIEKQNQQIKNLQNGGA